MLGFHSLSGLDTQVINCLPDGRLTLRRVATISYSVRLILIKQKSININDSFNVVMTKDNEVEDFEAFKGLRASN